MKNKPYLHSLLATAYIFLVSLLMNYGSKHVPNDNSLFAPVVFISVFTLSAAIMGYLFFYTSAVLYLDGKKKAALDFFFKTVAGFALITIILAILVFGNFVR